MRNLPSLATVGLAALALMGCNEAPGAPVVAIGPEAPTTVDDLSVTFIEEAVDPNGGDDVSYVYEWTVDGAPTEFTTASVPAEQTRAGQFWTVTVTPADNKLSGPSATASVAIENTPPSVTATISPAAPLSTEDLTLDVTPDDIDGDTVDARITWTRDGDSAGISGARVPADRTKPGEVWEATLVPQDARDQGEPFAVSVQIENQAPVMQRVILRPALAYEASVLEAVPQASDPDRDDVTYSYEWIVNGARQGAGAGSTLTGESFDRGDSVIVEVTANDGLADSAPMQSPTVDILNTPPTMIGVTVTPAEAFEDTTLTCAPEGWDDTDGDPAGYRYSWTVNGDVVSTAETIDGSVFNKTDRVVCIITPWDGFDEGRTQSTRPLTIQNTPPVATSITISPTDPESGTVITAAAGSTSDLDGDEVTLDIDWYVDSRKVAAGATLPAGAYVKGQTIYAEVTPNDGDADGTPVKSNEITAVNSPPRITAFSLNPTPLFTDNAATVTIATDDWDGDTVTVSYSWTINGTRYGDDSTVSVPPSETKKGDVVAVTVSTNDGTADGETDSTSQVVKLLIDPPTIAIDPPQPEDTDDLYCEITAGTTDPDGDDITYNYSWTKDGAEYTGSTTTTVTTGDTIPASATADDEDWVCEVYASSSNGASEVVTAEVTVGGLQVWSFTDGSSDDLAEKDVYDFFDGATYDSGYYISFEVNTGSGNGGQWCSERADWYADNYLTYSSGSTTLTSGSWNKWVRNTGGTWSGAITTGYSNFFGTGCDSQAYSWCSNWGISASGISSKTLGVMPKQTANESYASSWRSGSWTTTIKLAPTRKLACDF